jgi:acyl carrier protein
MVNHGSVINFVHDILNRKIFENEEDRIICITTLSFDIFAFESIVPLCTGHSIYMADETEQLDSALAAQKIVQYRVTHILSTVSRIKVFVDNPSFAPALRQLKCVLSGGENFPIQMLESIRANSKARIYNMYGPTETTIWSTAKDLTQSDSISIGKPIANTQIFILNQEEQVQPYGVYGEICIAGDGLARGYYHNQLETDKNFTMAVDLPGIKLYKTGDRGRMKAIGEVEISGRLDDQVKIRGYRIELSEIEKAALAHQDVDLAVVKVFEDADQNKNLGLFYTLKEHASSAPAQNSQWLRDWLKSRLLHYMVPGEFIYMEQMPTLPNGKINKKALVMIEAKKEVEVKVPPKSLLQSEILNIWKEVLQKDNIGINDNFFDAGGNSLALMMVNNKINSELGLTIPVMKLFEYPTIVSFVGAFIQSHSVSEGSQAELYAEKAEFDHDEFDDDGFDDDGFDEELEDAQAAVRQEEEGNIRHEDVAVIGMACRFPDAENLEEFWQNIMDGKESITFFEDDELLNSGIPKEIFEKENYVRAKGFLEGAEYFDNELFDYSDREAQMMDPQIRLLHQCTYEVLENAGYNSFDYDGKIAMFAGSGSNLLWMSKFGSSQNDSHYL